MPVFAFVANAESNSEQHVEKIKPATPSSYASNSRLLDSAYVGERHYQVAVRVKQTIQRHRELKDIMAMLGMKELRPEDQEAVHRSRRLERFLT
jgi:F0F1-type ATP synthase beta subunit